MISFMLKVVLQDTKNDLNHPSSSFGVTRVHGVSYNIAGRVIPKHLEGRVKSVIILVTWTFRGILSIAISVKERNHHQAPENHKN